MKNLKYTFLLVIAASCKKEKLLTYDSKDNVYFNYYLNAVRQDAMDIGFGYSPANVRDSTILIPILIAGAPADKDREYSLTVDPSSTATAADHYILPSKFVIRAGKVTDSFPLKLLRAKDLQDTAKNIILTLQSNSNFSTDLRKWPATGDTLSTLSLQINVTDALLPGPNWDGLYAQYFGNFSVKKIQLLNQVTGMPLDFPINGSKQPNMSARAALYAIGMSRYLKDQAAAGNTIYEADGVTPMTMGPNYQ